MEVNMDTTDAMDVMEVNMDTIDVMEVNVDTTDAIDAIDMDGANGPPNGQYPEQAATIPHTQVFSGASEIFGNSKTYMDLFDDDEYAGNRETNMYYPFASQPEWELASFLLKSGLSMVATDEFLKLQMVSAGVPV